MRMRQTCKDLEEKCSGRGNSKYRTSKKREAEKEASVDRALPVSRGREAEASTKSAVLAGSGRS